MNNRDKPKIAVLVSLSIALGGCVPSLNSNPPRDARREVPAVYAKAGQNTNASAAQKTWSAYFHDPHLKKLIGAALAGNQELNIRLQEMVVAKSVVMARGGEYLPKVGVAVGAGLEKVGEHTSTGVSDEAHDVPVHLQDYRFGFVASWEVDIWGKLRDAQKAAAFRYLATVEGKNFLVTQLVAEIANAYYELLALDQKLAVLERNIEIQQDALEIVKLQKEAAEATELAVQRFEAEVLKNQSRKFYLEQQIIQTENLINFLVGRYPQPIERDATAFDRAIPTSIGSGVPSQLLQNRPDVREAEALLQATKLDVDVARARFFPSLSIDAEVGYESFNVKHLIDTPASLLYNIAANITAPLLNRQEIKAEYFAANAEQLRAVFHYERTLLRAFTDVVNQLAMIKNLERSFELTQKQVEILTKAIEVSNILFQSAHADYMEVLMTRRDALEAELELIETKEGQLHALVNVYQALGGGWRKPPQRRSVSQDKEKLQ